MRRTRSAAAVTLLAVGVGVTGCGAGDRQDAHEKSGTFNVAVVDAKFPTRQRLAQGEKLVLAVRNADSRTIPDLAVTVSAFTTQKDRQDLADTNRAVWIVDDAPVGGVTAYTNTWALGALKPGETKTFTWKVTPVQAGAHKISYRIAAGLNGKAKAQLEGGGTPEGSFDVQVSGRPTQSHVNPDSGAVVSEGGTPASK